MQAQSLYGSIQPELCPELRRVFLVQTHPTVRLARATFTAYVLDLCWMRHSLGAIVLEGDV